MTKMIRRALADLWFVVVAFFIGLAVSLWIDSQGGQCDMSRRVLIDTASMCYLYPYDDDPWPHINSEAKLRACVDHSLDLAIGKRND